MLVAELAGRARPRRRQPLAGRGALLRSLDHALLCPCDLGGRQSRPRRAGRGGARLAEVFRKAGFTRFRRAAETPFNLILEARR
jgi:hypothetical protein